jgi:hypothetical protein
MAKKRAKPAKTLSAAQKKRFMKQLDAAAQGLRQLTASVTTLRKGAKGATFVGGPPMAARRRRRKRA